VVSTCMPAFELVATRLEVRELPDNCPAPPEWLMTDPIRSPQLQDHVRVARAGQVAEGGRIGGEQPFATEQLHAQRRHGVRPTQRLGVTK
jgi:hypothetical protein